MKNPQAVLFPSRKSRLMTGSAIALAAMTGAAMAQGDTSANGIEQVTVTASRAAPSGYQAPTPTLVVGQDMLDQQQVTNLADLFGTLPEFKPTISPEANGVRTQAPGASLADLRGLGSNRTLLLIDGMRVVPQAPANNTGIAVSPDMNVVPSLMVQRVEVVTGGASAQWGSDAVAGVVNILLRDDFTGFEAKAQAGISQLGDAGNERLGVLYGDSFAGDKGHFVVGVDATNNDRMGDYSSRSWGRQSHGIVTVPGTTPAQQVLSPNVFPVNAPGGLITSAGTTATRFSLLGDEFLPNGTLQAFNFGSNGAAQITTTGTNKISATQMIGGEGVSLEKGVSLAPGIQRANPYAYLSYQLDDSTKIYLEAGYSYDRGKTMVLPSRDSADTIAINNYYLTQLPQYNSVILPAMTAAGITSFSLSRINYDLGGNAVTTIVNATPHAGVGAKGALTFFGSDWQWDAHAGASENIYTNATAHNRIKANFNNAVNAVSNGAGGVTCASATAVAASCAPIDLFGNGSPSAAAIAYVTGTEHSRSEYDQQSLALNLKGEPFSLWAGPVAVAAGFEYRSEHQRVTSDALAAAGGYEASNAAPFGGSFNVKEGYLEVILPLLKDLSFAKALDLDSTVRFADYSTVGDATTWKEGVNWTIVDGVRLRATDSRDIRAPALFELFSPGSISNIPVGQSPSIPANTTIGNPNLKAEVASTVTAGVVLEPADMLPGFSFSLDYYSIKLKGAITSFTGAQVDSLCLAGQTSLCQYITGPLAAPTAVNAPVLNLASVESQGFDLAASYRTDAPDLLGAGSDGSLNFGLNVTDVQHVYVNTGAGPTVDRAGENSQVNTYALPHVRLNFNLTYADGPAALTAQVNIVSAGKIDNTFNTTGNATLNNNQVPLIGYLNLFGSYSLTDEWQLTAGISNVMNQAPPPIPSTILFTPTNGSYYDTVGRAFSIGVTDKF